MAEINPFLKGVIGTTCQLAVGNGEFIFNVYDADGKLQTEEVEELNTLFSSQTRKTGGIARIVEYLLCESMFFSTGIAMEAVFDTSDKDGKKGYRYLYPFFAETLHLATKVTTDEEILVQEQSGKYVAMNENHVYWEPNDPRMYLPSGTLSMSSALIELFGDLLMTTSLRDGVRSAGQPIRIFRYDKTTIIERLRGVLNLLVSSADFKTKLKAEVDEIRVEAEKAKNLEYIVTDKSTEVSHLDPADFAKVVPAVDVLQTRLASSLHTHKSILGFGNATTKASLDYQLSAGYIEWKRSSVLNFLERMCERHFLFQGKIRKVKITPPRIHLNEGVVEETIKEHAFYNALREYAVGAIDYETFCMRISGQKPAGQPLDGAIDALLKNSKGDKNQSSNPSKSGGVGGKPAG
jgi:hypothetical protein